MYVLLGSPTEGQKKPPLPMRGLGGNSRPSRQTASCTARTTMVKSATLSYHFYLNRQVFRGSITVEPSDARALCRATELTNEAPLGALQSGRQSVWPTSATSDTFDQ